MDRAMKIEHSFLTECTSDCVRIKKKNKKKSINCTNEGDEMTSISYTVDINIDLA